MKSKPSQKFVNDGEGWRPGETLHGLSGGHIMDKTTEKYIIQYTRIILYITYRPPSRHITLLISSDLCDSPMCKQKRSRRPAGVFLFCYHKNVRNGHRIEKSGLGQRQRHEHEKIIWITNLFVPPIYCQLLCYNPHASKYLYMVWPTLYYWRIKWTELQLCDHKT